MQPRARWTPAGILYQPEPGIRFELHGDGSLAHAEGASPAKMQAYLDNAVLALSLHVRQRLVLHASCVALSGRAVAIMGESGWGKSTLSGFLRRHGATFLADDTVEVRHDGTWQAARPGPAQVRLWPDAAKALGLDVDSLAPVLEGSTKRKLAAEGVEQAPLAALYVITRGAAEPGITALAPSEAMVELARFTFARRLLADRPERWHFELCTRLVQDLPVHRLHVPEGLDGAEAAAKAVVRQQAGTAKDAGGLAGP